MIMVACFLAIILCLFLKNDSLIYFVCSCAPGANVSISLSRQLELKIFILWWFQIDLLGFASGFNLVWQCRYFVNEGFCQIESLWKTWSLVSNFQCSLLWFDSWLWVNFTFVCSFVCMDYYYCIFNLLNFLAQLSGTTVAFFYANPEQVSEKKWQREYAKKWPLDSEQEEVCWEFLIGQFFAKKNIRSGEFEFSLANFFKKKKH